MSDTDPLLHALQGDPACPDGEALVRLGELVRAQRPRPADLRDAVRARLRQGGRSVRAPASAMAVRPDAGRRWKVISVVAAAHLAAGLALAVWRLAGPDHDRLHDASDLPVAAIEAALGHDAGDAGAPAGSAAIELPRTWSDAAGHLLMLRRVPELREQARERAGFAGSRPAVQDALAWLARQVDPASGAVAGPELPAEAALARQALVALALLGEGDGGPERATALHALLPALAAADLGAHGRLGQSLATLALVEGALLVPDTALRPAAEAALARLADGLPPAPGPAGLGGAALLAVETASQGGLRVPGRFAEDCRRLLARSLPAGGSDGGRIGLAAFGRLINGHRSKESTCSLIATLAAQPPAAGADGRLDPLGWLMPALALREAGGDDWRRWGDALQALLVPALVADPRGGARLPAVRCAWTADDATATAAAVLVLQVPYRYLPLARE